MPTGYTAPVQDGTITDVTEFAATCARAFGAFIHQRDDSTKSELRYPESPYGSFYERSLAEAQAEYDRWTNLSEEARYAEWSAYYHEQVKAGIKANAKDDVERARYKAMIAQVESIDVPAELDNFKEFMLEQLHESIRFDCPEDRTFTDDWYRPQPYEKWCADRDERTFTNIGRYKEELDKEWGRYEERCDYIDLMAKTFGFKVKGGRYGRRPQRANSISG